MHHSTSPLPSVRPRSARLGGSRRVSIVAGLAIALTGFTAVSAQDAKRPTERPRDTQQVEQDEAAVTRLASDLLARTVLRRSRNLTNSTTEDYRLTALGLHLARRAAPEDAELLRHEIQAWTAADDVPRVMAATRQLIRLDPRDSIAQLRLIDTQIGRLNTVEERRAAYDRLLGPAGRNLRAPIRSRLALDAALLAREDGDQEQFLRLLTDATLLDGTNKNAAALYASVLLQFADTSLERFELIANVLQSDPLDLGAYENAAIELLAHGAYSGSLRFLNRMRDLLTRNGQDFMSRSMLTQPRFFDEARVNDYLIATWQSKGAKEALSFITDAQGQIEAVFNAEVKAMRERGFTEAQLQEAISANGFPYLPHQLELFRLLTLIGQSEDDAKTMAFKNRPLTRDQFAADLNPFGLDGFSEPPAPTPAELETIRRKYPESSPERIELIAQLNARAQREINPVHEAATRYLLASQSLLRMIRTAESIDDQTRRTYELNLALESIWMLLIAELSVDTAENRLATIIEGIGEENLQQSALQRYRGWIACNRGNFETARELLTPVADSDATALYALAMTEYRSGNTDRAIELFDRVRTEFPATALACISKDRINLMTGRPPTVPSFVRELDAYAMNFAPWLERVTRSPREFMSLTVRPTRTTLGPLDRAELILLLKNTSGRALAVGPSSPINSRFLLTPRIEIEGTTHTDLIRNLLRQQARAELNLAPDAPFPQQIIDRVEQLIDQEATNAGRRLLEVVDADRVLRLEPNETLVIPIWAGRGNAGEIIDRDLTERVTMQWSIAQGFVQTPRQNPDGSATQGFSAGPMSMSTGTERQLRIKLSAVSAEVLSERIRVGDGAELAQSLLHATSLLGREGRAGIQPGSDADSRMMRSAIIDRAPSLSDSELGMLLLRLNELGVLIRDQELRRTMRVLITDRITESPGDGDASSRLLTAAALVSLTRAADEPLLRLAQESDDPELAEFAAVLASILERSGFVSDPDTLNIDPTEQPDTPVIEFDADLLEGSSSR